MDWRLYLRLGFIVLILFSFYLFGVPVPTILLMGAIFVVLLFLRGPLYKKIDENIILRFPWFGKLHPWVQKIIVLFIFILIYYVLKQVLFFGLSIFGIDIQQIIMDSIYFQTNKNL